MVLTQKIDNIAKHRIGVTFSRDLADNTDGSNFFLKRNSCKTRDIHTKRSLEGCKLLTYICTLKASSNIFISAFSKSCSSNITGIF